MKTGDDSILYILFDYSYSDTFFYASELPMLNWSLVTNERDIQKSYLKIFYMTLHIPKLLSSIPVFYHDSIKTFDSKKLFVEYIIKYDMSQYIPMTYYSDPLKFPWIIKPIYGIGGDNTIIFTTDDEYNLSPIKYNNNFLIQDYILSTQQNVAHVLCNRGKIVHSIVYIESIQEKYYIKRGRVKNYSKRFLTENELTIFCKIMNSTCYHGICSIDYVYDQNNELKIFEINPRMGGSLFFDKTDFTIFIKCIDKYSIIYT